MQTLLLGLMLLPVIAGILALFVGRQVVWVRRYAGLAITAIAFVCALGLLFFAEQDVAVPVAWLPGADAWSLHVGGMGLVALVVTVGTALVTRIVVLAGGKHCSPGTDAIFLIALGSSGLAFLTGHFLARYLALEIVALCVAAACLVQLRSDGGPRAGAYVYLILRIGDAGLLAAILLLLRAGNTLDVSAALQAGMGLSGMPLVWIVGALALAVWVKVGAWPFYGWQRLGMTRLPLAGAWMYGILMPQLGLYLLYRVTPLVSGGGGMLLLVLALASGAVAALLWSRADRGPSSSLIYGGAILGSLGLAVAGLGFVAGVSILLIVGALLRLGVMLWRMIPVSTPAAVSLAGANERTAPALGTMEALRGVMRGSLLMQDVGEAGSTTGGDAVAGGEADLPVRVEEVVVEDLLHGAGRAVVALSRVIQRIQTGNLRLGTLWLALSLVVVVLLALRGAW